MTPGIEICTICAQFCVATLKSSQFVHNSLLQRWNLHNLCKMLCRNVEIAQFIPILSRNIEICTICAQFHVATLKSAQFVHNLVLQHWNLHNLYQFRVATLKSAQFVHNFVLQHWNLHNLCTILCCNIEICTICAQFPVATLQSAQFCVATLKSAQFVHNFVSQRWNLHNLCTILCRNIENLHNMCTTLCRNIEIRTICAQLCVAALKFAQFLHNFLFQHWNLHNSCTILCRNVARLHFEWLPGFGKHRMPTMFEMH